MTLPRRLRMRFLKVQREEGAYIYFEGGSYNKETGLVSYPEKRLPLVLDNMNKLHKMSSGHPLYWLNVFFGVALLFFVVSSFWMFRPNTPIFKKGLYFSLGEIMLTLILLFL